MTKKQPYALADQISKRFYGTQALDKVSIAFNAGEVHALVGENGAGKSTLMKIFGGILQPDSGRILIDGAPVRFRSPREALAAGIVVIPHPQSDMPGGKRFRAFHDRRGNARMVAPRYFYNSALVMGDAPGH